MAVHWILIEFGVAHELELVDFAAKAKQSAEYLTLNANDVVPTLLVDGVAQYQVTALLMLLAERHPQAGFAPDAGPARRADCLQWMFNPANAVQAPFRIRCYPQEIEDDDRANSVLSRAKSRSDAALDRLDAGLAIAGPDMLGSAISAASFMLAMLMRWSRDMSRPAAQWPHLARLSSLLEARPSFTELPASEDLPDWP